MIWLVWCTAIVAAVAFTAAGYLFGVRNGKAVRRSLEANVDVERRNVARLEADLGQADAKAAAVAKENDALQAEDATHKAQMAKMEGLVDELRRQANESKRLRDADVQAFRRQMSDLLSPMIERERLNRELSQLDTGSGSLGELPRFLESMASKAGFDALVLSDEAGLPLAASRSANGVDEVAGISAMFLALADRIAAHGASAPTALLVRDQSEQMVIHRIFRAGGVRFLLSGITHGANVAPCALDPALGKLERLLLPRAQA